MSELSKTAHLVLGMIRNGRRTGYDIKRLVEVSTRFFWAASPGQIYPELKRLEAGGLLSRSEEPHGQRVRSVYSLTDDGERALHEWLTGSSDLTFELRNEGLLKLFFADGLSANEAIEVVRAMRAEHEAILNGIRKATPAYRADRKFGYITWLYGLGLHGWVVDWCRQLERDLAEGRVPFEREARDASAAKHR
ncbi:MAG: PadR family transcriptional regulator [Solirubrobacterales bacterium]|nr:PadR family transcriptional regulator [Solirubrobacterales bacterium]